MVYSKTRNNFVRSKTAEFFFIRKNKSNDLNTLEKL